MNGRRPIPSNSSPERVNRTLTPVPAPAPAPTEATAAHRHARVRVRPRAARSSGARIDADPASLARCRRRARRAIPHTPAGAGLGGGLGGEGETLVEPVDGAPAANRLGGRVRIPFSIPVVPLSVSVTLRVEVWADEELVARRGTDQEHALETRPEVPIEYNDGSRRTTRRKRVSGIFGHCAVRRMSAPVRGRSRTSSRRCACCVARGRSSLHWTPYRPEWPARGVRVVRYCP